MPITRPEGGGLDQFVRSGSARTGGIVLDFDPAQAELQAIARRSDPNAQIGYDQSAAQTEANRREALRLVEALEGRGVTSGGDYEKALQIAEYGEPVKSNFFTRALGWLDKPGQLVRYAIADITGADEDMGAEIEGGDYWDIIMGRRESLKRRLGEDLVGVDARLGGSKLLELAGYEQTGGFWPGLLRGVASVGTEILTDPITLTSAGASAIPRKARLAALRGGVTKGTAGAAQAAKTGTISALRSGWQRKAATEISENAERVLRGIDAATPGVGGARAFFGEAGVARLRNEAIDRAAWQTRTKAIDELAPSILGRDFGAPAVKAFAEYEGAPSFLLGGIRIHATPWGALKAKGGWTVPGTRGLGRKITRGLFGQTGKIEGQVATGLQKFLRTHIPGAMKALDDFSIRQRFHSHLDSIMAGRVSARADEILESVQARFISAFGMEDAAEQQVRDAKRLRDAFRGSPLSETDVRDVLRDVVTPLLAQGTKDRDILLGQVADALAVKAGGKAVPKELSEAVVDFTVHTSAMLRHVEVVARATGVLDRSMENYFPQMLTPEGRQVVEQLAESAADPLSRGGLAGELLAELLGATRLRRLGGAAVGESGFAAERVFGKHVRVLGSGYMVDEDLLRTLVGDSVYAEFRRVAAEAGSMQPGYFPLHTLNGELGPLVEELAAEAGITIRLPRSETAFRLFETDPLLATHAYLESMQGAVFERMLFNELSAAGILERTSPMVDTARTSFDILTALKSPKSMKQITRSAEKVQKALGRATPEAVEADRGRRVTVSARGRVTSIPEEAATPEVIRRTERLLAAVARGDEAVRAAAEERARAVRGLVDRFGVTPEVAEGIASVTTVDEARRLMRAAGDAMDEMMDARREALLRAVERDPALEGAVSDALRVIEEERAVLRSEVEAAYGALGDALRGVTKPERVSTIAGSAETAAWVDGLIERVLGDTAGLPGYTAERVERVRRELEAFSPSYESRIAAARRAPETLGRLEARRYGQAVAWYEGGPAPGTELWTLVMLNDDIDRTVWAIAGLRVASQHPLFWNANDAARANLIRVLEDVFGVEADFVIELPKMILRPAVVERVDRPLGVSLENVLSALRERGLTFEEAAQQIRRGTVGFIDAPAEVYGIGQGGAVRGAVIDLEGNMELVWGVTPPGAASDDWFAYMHEGAGEALGIRVRGEEFEGWMYRGRGLRVVDDGDGLRTVISTPWDELPIPMKARLLDYMEKRGIDSVTSRSTRLSVDDVEMTVQGIRGEIASAAEKFAAAAPLPDEVVEAIRYGSDTLTSVADRYDAAVRRLALTERGAMLPTFESTVRPEDFRQVGATQFIDAFDGAWDRSTIRAERESYAVATRTTGEYLDELPEDMTGWRFFLSPDGKSGAAVKPDGEITAVFNVGDRGNGTAAFGRAVLEGGTWLNAYDEAGRPRGIYRRFGFVETERYAFDPAMAPRWRGAPSDVVVMRLAADVPKAAPKADAAAAVLKRVQTASKQRRWGQVVALLSEESNRRALKAAGVGEAADQYLVEATTRRALQKGDLPSEARRAIRERRNAVRVRGTAEAAQAALHDNARDLARVAAEARTEAVRQTVRDMAELQARLRRLGAGLEYDDAGDLVPTSTILTADVKGFKGEMAEARRLADSLGWDEVAAALDPKKAVIARPKPRGGKVLLSSFGLSGEPAEWMAADPFMAQFLDNVVRSVAAVNTPPGLRLLAQQVRGVLTWWKGMATVARPTFHPRNLIGGVWNNQIVDVRARDYAWVNTKLMRLRSLTEGKGAVTFEEALKKFSKKDAEILRAMRTHGVLQSSFSRSSFEELGLQRASVWPLSSRGPAVRAGSWTMQSIEDFLRASAFVRWYDEMGGEAAAQFSLAVHFDYRNLTDLEQQVKRFVPFFVWTRRNLPLQLSVLVERPDLVQRYTHLVHGIDDQYRYEPYDDMPGNPYGSALSIGTGIVFNADTPFWARALISPDLPLTDLEAIENPLSPTSWINFVTSTLGPQFSLPFQAQEQAEFGSINAPIGLAQTLQVLGALGLYDHRGGESGTPRIPRWVQTLGESAVPLYGELSRMFPTDPARQQRLGIEPGGGPEDFLQGAAVRLGSGLGLRTETPSDAYSRSFAVSDELQQLTKELRLRGVLPPEW